MFMTLALDSFHNMTAKLAPNNTTKYQSRKIACVVRKMRVSNLTSFILVLIACENVSSLQNQYGKNFKYRKKLYEKPAVSIEYPAFKQYDGKF